MADPIPQAKANAAQPRPKRKKLPKLPQTAKVTKRPLLRPAVPSQYSGSSHQKIVYISTKTPFLSAVKRVEKLLRLADKRLVQSATTRAKQKGGKRKRGGDEVLGIAEEVERLRGKGRIVGVGDGRFGGEDEVEGLEEVVLKGTGKAVSRVLELALWFQQREGEYVVRLRTGSVGAIDDITVEEEDDGGGGREEGADGGQAKGSAAASDGEDAMDLDTSTLAVEEGSEQHDKSTDAKKRKRKQGEVLAEGEVPETRIRYASTLEAAVSLR